MYHTFNTSVQIFSRHPSLLKKPGIFFALQNAMENLNLLFTSF